MSSPPDWTRGTPALVLSECAECDRRWYLPAERCRDCGCPRQRRFHACGDGRCVAFTRWHGTTEGHAAEPRALVLVELTEGPVVMGRADGELHPGHGVRLVFIEADTPGALLPGFRRTETDA